MQKKWIPKKKMTLQSMTFIDLWCPTVFDEKLASSQSVLESRAFLVETGASEKLYGAGKNNKKRLTWVKPF